MSSAPIFEDARIKSSTVDRFRGRVLGVEGETALVHLHGFGPRRCAASPDLLRELETRVGTWVWVVGEVIDDALGVFEGVRITSLSSALPPVRFEAIRATMGVGLEDIDVEQLTRGGDA